MKLLKLTIVIPVYNEEARLRNCLAAISNQTVAPDEVIIVDNNCTDGTIAIAKEFEFVKIVSESTQGMIPARNKGFNQANGDLIARIDADSILAPDWVQYAKTIFQDQAISAATGPALAPTLGRLLPQTRLWSLVYFWITEAEFRIPILWGPNMILRRSAWKLISGDVCLDDSLVHEDQDLSYLLAGRGKRVVRDNQLIFQTHDASMYNWSKLIEYANRRWQTKRYHRERGTLNSSSVDTYAVWQTIPRYLIVVLPITGLVATSLLFAALRLIMFAEPETSPAPAE